jgi:predicted hydrolase (HD superfamily)
VLSRFELFVILRNQVADRSLVKRALALEAMLEELAPTLGGDASRWVVAGLGVYIDVELTLQNPERRGEVAEEILLTEGAEPELARAVRERLAPEVAGLAAVLAFAERVIEEIYAALDGERLDGLDGRSLAFRVRRAAEKRSVPEAQRLVALAAQLGVELEAGFDRALTGMRRVREDLRL